MNVYYNPVVYYLLLPNNQERVEVLYNDNQRPFLLPLTWKRPPYFTNPRYEPFLPIL